MGYLNGVTMSYQNARLLCLHSEDRSLMLRAELVFHLPGPLKIVLHIFYHYILRPLPTSAAAAVLFLSIMPCFAALWLSSFIPEANL